MTFTVVIATFNRADDLRGTLDSIATLRPNATWEVIVVDNNSSDGTRQAVEAAAAAFPAPLRYMVEYEQGRSPALNAGIARAQGDIIVTTDDDVRVEPDWLDRAAEALGPDPIEFGARVPLGVNMAFRRSAFERAGLLDPQTGRKAGTLLGQEVREWCIRARAAGVRGFYAPEMVVRHIIPASRLTKTYFRRWFYWRGISRARLYEKSGLDMEAPERTTMEFRSVPHVFGVPRYLYRKALSSAFTWLTAGLRGDTAASFDHELWVWFFAGIVRQRWTALR